jgi:universal stress protein E
VGESRNPHFPQDFQTLRWYRLDSIWRIRVKVAQTLGLIKGTRVTVAHAFYPFAKGKMVMAGLDQASIDEYVASQRQTARDELSGFLVATGLGGTEWSRRVEEGRAFEMISRAVEEIRPDLLVMGTRGRSALVKLLIGSVTEEVLRSLNVDVLVVPPLEGSDQTR